MVIFYVSLCLLCSVICLYKQVCLVVFFFCFVLNVLFLLREMVQYSGTVYDSKVRIEVGKRGSGSGVVYVIPLLASGQHCSVTSIIVVGSTSQEYSVYRLQYYYVTSEPTANTSYTQKITHIGYSLSVY